MAVVLTAAHLRSAAARMGWRLGAKQAQDHMHLTGARQLSGKPLKAMAHLAWKYEGRELLGSERDERVFVDCYVTAYTSFTA